MRQKGIEVSYTGDIMIDEELMMSLQSRAGLDISDRDSIDTTKVIENAYTHGFTNLGAFGGRTGSSDNFVFHISDDNAQDWLWQTELGKVVEKTIDNVFPG